MATKKRPTEDQKPAEDPGLGGLLGGLSTLLEKLGDLAEKGKELRESGTFGDDKGFKAVYGFTVRSGLGRGGEHEGPEIKVEPFGNVRPDAETGKATVHEVTEPMVDVFEEPTGVLVVAELPGIGPDDVELELHGDVLTVAAARGRKKYRKEVLLPAAFTPDQMSSTCHNGVLEIKLKSNEQ